MEKALLSTLLFSFLYSNVHSAAFLKRTTESFIIHYLDDRRIIPVRVVLNSEQQTEHIVTPVGGETLYDFKQGKVAYKDQNSSQCFIADIVEESLERDRRKLENIQHGVVRGFYLPTFTIQQEFSNNTQLPEKFGVRLTRFCSGHIVSSVARQQQHRRKRDTTGDKGQFTHHSYGHYGQQSNNYAHYGHETHMTGNLDKDGNIRNHRVSHNQVRSESSHTYPVPSSRSGPQVPTSDSRNGIYSPQYQTQYQLPASQSWDSSGRHFGTGTSGQFALQTNQESGYQVNLPLGLKAGNAYRSGIRSGGQYSVGGPQPQITTEYQRYPDSVSPGIYKPSPDQTGLIQTPGQVPSVPGAPQPPIPWTQTGIPQVDYTKIRDGRIGTPVGVPSYQDLGQTRLGQPLSGASEIGLGGLPAQVEHTRIRDRGLGTTVGVPSYQDLDQTRLSQPLPGTRDISLGGLPTHVQPGVPASFPSVVTDGRQIQYPSGPPRTQISGTQTDSRRGTPRPPDPGAQMTLIRPDQRGFQTTVSQPGSSMIPPGHLTPSSVQDMRIPPSYIPGSTINRQIGLPGEVAPGIGLPRSHTTGIQPPLGPPSRPGYQVPSIYPDLGRQQDFLPGSTIPSHHLQTQEVRYPVGSQIPGLYPPGSYPSLPTPAEPDSRSATRISPPGLAATVPGIAPSFPQGTLARPDEFTQNGVSYPAGVYSQIPGGIRQEHPRGVGRRGDIYPGMTGIQPIDGRPIQTTQVRPGDSQVVQSQETGRTVPRTVPESIRGYQVPHTGIVPDSSIYSSRIPSTGISPGILTPGDRSVLTSQTRPGVSGVYGGGSASSQTQIQTNIEGTAAEASSAGQYQGLGSKTQVQGGYAGNGSFSAQAQSGFTGGVVQSQVQGSKQGGSSGSSSHVERVGAAQSQVQVGQPSGSASSTAQGRFSGGLTQVQAQSGKTGGSAGAQAQSTGLSNSHVQVNIGGKEVSEQDRFQGSVSASVQGGYSSGQAQTQLQGGYDSGRTYVATAQGGFDSTQGFQGSVPLAGTLPRLSNQGLRIGQPLGTTVSQESEGALRQRPTIDSSVPLVTQTSPGFPDGAQITQSARTRPFDQRTSIPGAPSSSDFTQPSSTFPDQRQPQPGRLPEQPLISPGTVPDRTPGSRTPSTLTETLAPGLPHGPRISSGIPSEDSHLRYPSSIPGIPGSPYLPQISQPTVRLPYPGYQPDLASIPSGAAAERPASVSQGLPGYAAYDQKTSLPSSVIPSSQQTGLPPVSAGFPSHSIDTLRPIPPSSALPGVISPGFQPATGQSLSPFPGYQQPSPFLPTPQQALHQQYNYITGMPIRPEETFQQPSGLAPVSPTHLESGYARGYPSGFLPRVQQPGFPTGQMPVPGRSDITGYPDQQTFYPPSLIPGQPQISPQHPQTISPQARPDETRVLTKPDDSQYIGLPRQLPTVPEQPQISPPKPQDSLSPGTIPASRIPSQPIATHTTQVGLPGPPEPDGGNCCEALRELKRRCCGKTTRKQNGSSESSCCRSKAIDFSIDFSSEDDLDDNKGDEPCKVVKAICYIVYKPVGKARVCKPTDTNGC